MKGEGQAKQQNTLGNNIKITSKNKSENTNDMQSALAALKGGASGICFYINKKIITPTAIITSQKVTGGKITKKMKVRKKIDRIKCHFQKTTARNIRSRLHQANILKYFSQFYWFFKADSLTRIMV